MSDFLLAIDQGTTSTRAIVFDAKLTPVASAQQEFAQLYPAPGWVEHDPEAIWSSTVDTARAAMEQAGAEAADVAALGIANQRETTIVWQPALCRIRTSSTAPAPAAPLSRPGTTINAAIEGRTAG